MSSAQQIAEKRAARKAAGLCTECDTPRLKGHSLCRQHYEAQRRRVGKYNERRIDRGLCYCGARVKPGRNRCPACLALANQKAKIRSQELKAAGKCVTCGRRRARPGKVLCLRCSARAGEYYRDRCERIKYRLLRRGQLASRLFELHAFSGGAV